MEKAREFQKNIYFCFIDYAKAFVWITINCGKFWKRWDYQTIWQPKWNENQTVLASAIHTLERDAGPLEGLAAGSWSLGIVEQSQGKGCCGLQRDGSRGCEGGDHGVKCLRRKAKAAMEARRYCWVMHSGWRHHHSLCVSTGQHQQLNNRKAGPSTCLTHWMTE